MRREYIKNEITLYGEGSNGRFSHTFRILGDSPSEGASSVCYEAYYEGSSRGVLKEFYPEDISFLHRGTDQQLACSDESGQDIEDFRKRREAYLAPYLNLQKMKRDEKYNELATFIPPFEIYCGLDDNSTVYVWTPLPKFLTFEEFCSDIHDHPKHGAGYKFIQVIDAVRYLARCVGQLQAGGLVNRDIKPSNIGFYRRGGEIQPQTLSMFDIDSVCFVDSIPSEIAYSEGYVEPEVKAPDYHPNYQTDIYSIGAVLFHALIVNDEARANNFLYRDEYYSRLEDLVASSELVRSAGADYGVRARLTDILRRCLCGRDRRYRDPRTGNALGCEKLTNDLDELFNDYTRGRTLYDERKNYLIDLEMNASLVLQYHLYEHPLYRFAGDDPDINVLLVGFGKYSDKFLDACLQAGQMMGRVLNVKVIIESFADRNDYLNHRPELAKFYNVDGSLDSKPDDGYDVYSNVSFIEMPDIMKMFTAAPDEQSLHKVLSTQAKCMYVFVDLRNDGHNLTAARSIASAMGKTCRVSFVNTGKPCGNDYDGITPVYVKADVSQLPEFREIERMAFNAHLSWLPNMNVDHEEEYRAFLMPYNHMSSIANVLNVKYKLASLSLDYDELTTVEAAKRFFEFLHSDDKEDKRKYDEMICIEHRRWTTERLCDGCLRKLPEECSSDGDTKTRENIGRRRVTNHVCIVRSRADQLLHNKWDNDMRKWNNPSDSELSELDELDRMSVELHLVFLAKAREAMRENILDDDILAGISGLIESGQSALSAFNDLCICMKDIMTSINDVRVDSARKKVSHYERLSKAFKKALDSSNIPQENKEKAAREIRKLEGNFRPILDSMRFRDYKHSDTDLIDSIPFILTYSDNITMVIPYIDDMKDKTKFFGNAASAIVINPSRIIYVSYLEDDDDATKLRQAVGKTGACIAGKNLRARVEFVIVKNSYVELPDNMTDEISRAFGHAEVRILKEASDDRPIYDASEAVKILAGYLESKRAAVESDGVFALENNSSRLSGMLEGTERCQSFAHYRFISKSMSFVNVSGCELFEYVRKAQSLMRSDMFTTNTVLAPEFFRDYGLLWTEYSTHKSSWKKLCDGLGKYEDARRVIAVFPIMDEGQKKAIAEERKYILPSTCRDSVEYILSSLRRNNILEGRSTVINYTTSSFEVTIIDKCGYGEKYDDLFGNPYRLMSLDALDANDDSGERVEIEFDDLIANNVGIPGFGTRMYDGVVERVEFFRKIGFVSNLKLDEQNGVMSFTYAARDIKQLMTTSGRILEVYVYHKARELGYFDDVVSSLGVKWGINLNIRNEFDCILIKGFRTLFIECKARNVLEQGMYTQLDTLSRQLGINYIPVLVADTAGAENGRTANINHGMRERGRELGIITVWKPEEIEDIGSVLMQIMNGKYKPQY